MTMSGKGMEFVEWTGQPTAPNDPLANDLCKSKFMRRMASSAGRHAKPLVLNLDSDKTPLGMM
jgi:hypothetical protein